MDIDAKLRPLFLLQILKERTDEDNYLTTTQLCDILKREYGLDTHRTTLKSDIEVLQRAGYSIDERRSTQNQYRFIEREFEVAELKTIIDAVASSKFIAEGKSNELIKKLTSLAGSHKARELKRNVIVDGRGKIENKQKNSVLNRPMYLCLCPVCLGQFLDTGIYKIVRENHGQAKERCDFCNYRNGYDFIIYSKAEKKDEVADEWQ